MNIEQDPEPEVEFVKECKHQSITFKLCNCDSYMFAYSNFMELNEILVA